MRIVVSGELDLATEPELRETLADAYPSATGKVILDLTEVGFIDSTGLRLLMLVSRDSRDAGDRLRIIPSAAISRLVELTCAQESLALAD